MYKIFVKEINWSIFKETLNINMPSILKECFKIVLIVNKAIFKCLENETK